MWIAEAGRFIGWCGRGGWVAGAAAGVAGGGWHGLAFADDGDVVDDDRGERLVVGVASTRAMEATSRTVWASHWPKMVCLPLSCGTAASVMKNCEPLVLGPELAMARRPGSSKVRVGVDLVLEEVAGIAGAVADAVAALDHEAGDDAMEGGAVVEGLTVHLLEGLGVGPVLGAIGETDEVGDGHGGLLVVELAGEAAHGGVDDGGGAGGDDGRL